MTDDLTSDDPTKVVDPRIVRVDTDLETIQIKTTKGIITQYDIFKTIFPDPTLSYMIMHKDEANNKTYFTQVKSESVQPNYDGGSRKTKRCRRKSRRRRNKKLTRRRRRRRH